MTWVRRAEPPAPKPERHQCTLPYPHDAEVRVGDLWRCDTCGDLWRVAAYCPSCAKGYRLHRRLGGCLLICEWRPARWWQRLRHRDRPPMQPATGVQVISTRMADGYDPPSTSLKPPAYRPEKIQRGGQVPAPNATEPPVRDRVPSPPGRAKEEV